MINIRNSDGVYLLPRGLFDEPTAKEYNAFMFAAKKFGTFDDIKRIFDAAVQSGACDADTFNIYIVAAGSQRIGEVVRAVNLAFERKLANICTANNMILLAGEAKQFDLACRMFHRVEQTGNTKTYGAMLQVCAQMNKFEEARYVFKVAKKRAASGQIRLDKFIIGNFMLAANDCEQYGAAIAVYNKISKYANDFIKKQYQYAVKMSGRKG